MTRDRDWRESAYLSKHNWPDAIPPMGPSRRYGPYPWGPAESDIDPYPSTHPDASSIGTSFLGDVCPYCGVPLSRDEKVVMQDGSITRGVFDEINDVENPMPAYHPDCWEDRQAEIHGHRNQSLSEITTNTCT